MRETELRWVGSGPDRAQFVGFVPRISVDPRIRCPRLFTEEFPPPPPPTQRYSELALAAAQKIVVTMWSGRQYIEVIKISYSLDDHSGDFLSLVGDVVIARPNGEKLPVSHRCEIGSRHGHKGMTLELTGPEQEYDKVTTRLANILREYARRAIKSREDNDKRHIEDVKRFQTAFDPVNKA